MRKIFLFFILLFPMSVYSDVNNYQDSDYVKNNFSIKDYDAAYSYSLLWLYSYSCVHSSNFFCNKVLSGRYKLYSEA